MSDQISTDATCLSQVPVDGGPSRDDAMQGLTDRTTGGAHPADGHDETQVGENNDAPMAESTPAIAQAAAVTFVPVTFVPPPDFEKSTLDRLSKVLQQQTRQVTFTCGGTLPILLTPEGRMNRGDLTPILDEHFGGARMMARSVSLRWGGYTAGRTLTLPAIDDQEGAALQQLVEDCKPATFGRGGEDVYDETYRRATALDVTEFMTDFCPYEAGIIDIVAQYLLPAVCGDFKTGPERSKLTAKHDLTYDQEVQVHAAIQRRARQRGNFINSSDVQSCLEELQILPSTEEMLQLMGRLDRFGTGLAEKGDVADMLAQRLSAKDRARKPAFRPNDSRKRMMSRGIRAELYKMNVYSGPSGHFKAHVDTSRSDMQIGSLVVCLPVPFTGGALAVRHSGREVTYKWDADKPAIRWAAFYSDCEHAVLEVTSGHRITLTYNLFLARGHGLLTGSPKTLDAPSLPLFGHLQKMLASDRFFPKGCYLGFHLGHSYPHTHPRLWPFVPEMLKGSDMALYEAMAGLGLVVVLDAIAKNYLPSEDAIDSLEEAYKQQRHPNGSSTFISKLEECVVNYGGGYEDNDFGEDDSDLDMEKLEEYKLDRWGSDSDSNDDDPDSDHVEDDDKYRPEVISVKHRLEARNKIIWLGSKGSKEISEIGLAYGNEAELRVRYSSAALIVKIPKWSARKGRYGSKRTSPQGEPIVID